MIDIGINLDIVSIYTYTRLVKYLRGVLKPYYSRCMYNQKNTLKGNSIIDQIFGIGTN